MSQYDELLAAIPMSQLAQQVGADESQVSQAVQQVLPALMGGLGANARQPEGKAALTSALSEHVDRDPGDLSSIDTDDGAKIVQHIFGNQSETVVNQLGGLGGGGGGLVKKLLPILAPIVLSFLAKKLSGGGGLGGAMGDILGGGAQAPTQKPAAPTGPAGQGDVGDLLGDLLGSAVGGGKAPQGGGGFGLDDILGGLLGGKR
ncbi:DUF937 domain-containing protein [Ornithinimicrobium cryptoxanthini]|uniref:DUF937 domain-containing protein n=1 Tax=Ornithinimicrobium cryptoxanthini TaxID=2934161 RepID=UPI002119A717|nr:DUF937 domain-containing protein [Ornithinimicrobium cryptoxanthini]